REAAHNIAGNPVAVPPGADFPAIEFLTDPVWRKDRIDAINAHFISAFFDLHLKGDGSKRRYLNVPTPFANQGQWPSAFDHRVVDLLCSCFGQGLDASFCKLSSAQSVHAQEGHVQRLGLE
ncbi:MAG: hypothetical protein ACK442_01330, partial [Novosphingobium sp.]